MNRSTLFCVIISFCIVYINCTSKKGNNPRNVSKFSINQVSLTTHGTECINVEPEWSSSIVSLGKHQHQVVCVLLYHNRYCIGNPITTYQPFNASTFMSFKKCEKIIELTTKSPQTNKRINTFDIELLSSVVSGKYQENVVISPASIKSILALLVEASSSDTEILRALQLMDEDRDSTLTLLRELQSHLNDKTSSITLESRNRIYKANDVKVQTEYENLVKDKYRTDFQSVNFLNPAQASTTVNDWINKATRGLIPTIVEADQITENTKLLLLNYIYFKAKWDVEFNPQLTKEDCFDKPVTGCQQVKYMYRKRQLNYTSSDELKTEIFEIPFKNPRYAIVFMLPYKDQDVYELMNKLKRKDLPELFRLMKDETIHLRIPRTVVEFSSHEMIQSLEKVGIKSIFEKNAKLDRMVPKSSGWSVSEVVHKARIEMNEEGAEAAAVAGGNIEFLSLDIDKYVVVNRPYLFFLRDTLASDLLFEGVVFSPENAK